LANILGKKQDECSPELGALKSHVLDIRSHGGDLIITMQLFISILPLSFVIVTQNCMIGYHVLSKYTCIEYFLYESIYLTQFGDGMICVLVISLLEFASYLFCTLLLVMKPLVLVLKRKLSYHRCRSIRAAPLCILSQRKEHTGFYLLWASY
jgi:hypothetical protein